MKRNPHSLKEKTLREILRDQRLKINMRQIDLAEKLNSPQQFISKYESGDRLLTFAETIKICQALRLDPHKLLEKYLLHCENESYEK